jgi:branched-chain amino acid transport system substrate-binding protein
MNKTWRRIPAVLTAGLLLLGACGTRASDAQIAAEAGGNTTSLSPAVLKQIQEAAAAGAASAVSSAGVAAPAAGAAPAAPAAASGGTAPAPAAATGSAATASAPGTTAAAGAKPGAKKNTVSTQSAAAPAAPASGAAACTKALDPVAIGQVGTFSGVTGPAWTGGRTALAIWTKSINDRGGLACHPVKLYFGDDAGDPARSSALISQFVKDDHVIAFTGGHNDFSMAGFKQGLEANKVPAVGGDLIAPEWYGSSDYLFPQGSSIDDQAAGIIKQLVAAGKTKAGLLYCVEVKACTYLNSIAKDLAKKAGATFSYSSAISLTQTDFTAQCQSAKSAGVDQLLLGMDGTEMARVARSCQAIGYRPAMGGLGGTISPGQSTDPTLRQFTLATASAIAPWTESSTPGLKEYQDAVAKYAPGEQTSGSSVQMWAAAKLIEAAVHELGAAAQGTLTSAMMIQGLHKVHSNNLGGLTGPLTLGPGRPKSNGCIFWELLTTKGWSAPRGAKPICG